MPKFAPECLSFSDENGGIVVVTPDMVFDDDHPYVKAYPKAFQEHEVNRVAKPIKAAAKDAKVEKATAEPGETRDVEKPKTRKFGTVT